MKYILPRPIRKAFKDAGIPLDKYLCAKSAHFNILIYEPDNRNLQPGERKWIIRFGYKKTFDRWANSTNFVTEIHYDPKPNQRFQVGDSKGKRRKQYLIPNLKKELAWCYCVAKSGLFNWNTYFASIETPWFIYDK